MDLFFPEGEMMEDLKKRLFRHVFQCITAWLIILNGSNFGSVFAQNEDEPKWSKTAKSLTIFQPGDAIRIQVWELFEEERRNLNLSGDYSINSEGLIIMPLIGEVKVKGVTVYELMQTLRERFLLHLRNPYISVRPLIRVTMQGAFNRPGSYRTDPASSLWGLVDLAGGPSANCNLKGMWVERGGEVVIRNLLGSFEKGYSLEEVGVESGDQIIVPYHSTWDLAMLIGVVNLVASFVLLYLRLRYRTW